MKRPRLSVDPDAAVYGRGTETAEWDGARFVRARRGRPEAGLQSAIKNRLALHGIVCVAVPNEGRRSAILGRAMKATGLLPGFPDLLVMQAPGRIAFLEVKAPAGRVSEAQKTCHELLNRLGFFVRVVRSQEDAIEALHQAGFKV